MQTVRETASEGRRERERETLPRPKTWNIKKSTRLTECEMFGDDMEARCAKT